MHSRTSKIADQVYLIAFIYINIYEKTIHDGNFLDKLTDHMPNFCIIEDTYKVKKNREIRIGLFEEKFKHGISRGIEERACRNSSGQLKKK